jgi:hypothetical protein
MDTKIIYNLMSLLFKFLKAKNVIQLAQAIMIQNSKPLNQKKSLGPNQKQKEPNH